MYWRREQHQDVHIEMDIEKKNMMNKEGHWEHWTPAAQHKLQCGTGASCKAAKHTFGRNERDEGN